jgi:hypothetical protein
MPILVKYLLSTGRIDGLFTGTSQDMLAAQIVPDDPTYGYLLTERETEIDARTLTQRYAVVAGALQEKALLTIVADPVQFQADGLDVCLISVEPIVACTLRIGSTEMALTTADPILELTCDTPQQIVMTLVPMPTHWAEPITVEAR